MTFVVVFVCVPHKPFVFHGEFNIQSDLFLDPGDYTSSCVSKVGQQRYVMYIVVLPSFTARATL